MRYPADPNAPPEMTYNCRCTVGYELKKYPSRNMGHYESVRKQTYDDCFAQKEEQIFNNEIVANFVDENWVVDVDGIRNEVKSAIKQSNSRFRSYIEAMIDGVEIEESQKSTSAFSYSEKEDKVYYNPNAKHFYDYDVSFSIIHELLHRTDFYFISSQSSQPFKDAIKTAEKEAVSNAQSLKDYCLKNDNDGNLSDIVSALLSADNNGLPYGHEKAYWKRSGIKEKEIFVAIALLDIIGDDAKLNFIRNNFGGLMSAFEEMTKGV